MGKADARGLNNDSVKLNEALARATVGPTRELFRRIGEQQRDPNEIFFMAHALIHPKVMAAEAASAQNPTAPGPAPANITAADVAQATGSRAKILAQNRTYSAPAALFGLINATTIQAARQKASKAAASTKNQAPAKERSKSFLAFPAAAYDINNDGSFKVDPKTGRRAFNSRKVSASLAMQSLRVAVLNFEDVTLNTVVEIYNNRDGITADGKIAEGTEVDAANTLRALQQANPAQALQMVGGASYGSDSRIAKLMAFVGVEKPDQLRHILRIIMMTLSTNVGLPKLIIMWAVSVFGEYLIVSSRFLRSSTSVAKYSADLAKYNSPWSVWATTDEKEKAKPPAATGNEMAFLGQSMLKAYATKESKGKGVAYPPAVQSIVNAIGELSGDYDADLNRLLSAHNQYLTMYSEVSDVKSFTEIVAPVGAHLAANMASNQSRKATSLSPLAAMTSEIVLHRGIDNLKRMNAYGKGMPQSLKAAAISDTNAVVSPSQYVNNGVAPAVLSAYIGYLGN